jgi:hypothetical protein
MQASKFLCLSMIFSDLPSPAEAWLPMHGINKGFAKAGNRFTLFRFAAVPVGIML